MEPGAPSRTALATAYARAYHQVVDEPRVFTDPLAERILGVTDAELATLDTAGPDHPGHAGASHRPRRLFIAARARFAEDAIRDAVAAGTRQAVILGAGLDTFACRNPYPRLRVFEVDHPGTQAWKRDRLAAAAITPPETLTFAPVDFETETLASGLAAAGFDRSAPAIFVWLGVVVYLTSAAIDATLDYLAGQATPTDLVLDYGTPPATPADHTALRVRAARVAALGEPWLSYFTPADITARLRRYGFTHIEDHPAQNLITTYTSLLDVTFPGPHLIRATR